MVWTCSGERDINRTRLLAAEEIGQCHVILAGELSPYLVWEKYRKLRKGYRSAYCFRSNIHISFNSSCWGEFEYSLIYADPRVAVRYSRKVSHFFMFSSLYRNDTVRVAIDESTESSIEISTAATMYRTMRSVYFELVSKQLCTAWGHIAVAARGGPAFTLRALPPDSWGNVRSFCILLASSLPLCKSTLWSWWLL